MINKKRVLDNFLEMVNIYSPSKNEKEYGDYLIKKLEELGLTVYLDNNFQDYSGNCPTIFAKLKGNLEGEGITLAAHLDVIEPNKDVQITIDGDIIRTDGRSTLGGDDKAGIACILEVIKVIKENNMSHKDIFLILTPGEEIGMAGAKSINWENVPKEMRPAKNMIVVDNAGQAGLVAHTAPSKYNFKIEFCGKKAHAGIEPEKGINSIVMAGKVLSNINIGRIDSFTTSNVGKIESNFPTNVVPDNCYFEGEIRGHQEERILDIIENYKSACENMKKEMGGEYIFSSFCDFPPLKPNDDLKFAKEFVQIYESLGIKSELKTIGGGSDSNIFAKEGYNSIIIGVGMYDVHTVEENLHTLELFKTIKAVLKYIS